MKNGWVVLGAVAAIFALLSGTEGHDLMGGLVACLAFCAAVTQGSAFRGILATSALCLGCNVYLLNIKWSATEAASKCNIDDYFNCDIINQSAASEVAGIPITLFGAAYYLGLLFAALASERSPKALFPVCGVFSILSLAYSAWLALQSYYIGAFCLVCATIYVGNVILLWAAIQGARQHEVTLFGDLANVARSRAATVLTACFVLVTGFGALSQPPGKDAPLPSVEEVSNPVDFIAQLYSLPEGSVALDGTEKLLGDPNATYTIIEFADYGCPHCAVAESELTELLKARTDVQLRFKPYPLASQCNDAIQYDQSPERCQAAAAAECSGQQGKYFEMAHQLFANQGYFSDSDLTFMAKALQLDMDQYAQCMASPDTYQILRKSAAAGNKAGIHGTSSFLAACSKTVS